MVIVPKHCPNATQLGYGRPQIYRIAGTFSRDPTFAILHNPRPKCEHVNFCINFWTHENDHTCVLCNSLTRSDDGTVKLFQTGRWHPILTSFVLCPAISIIKAVNEAIRESTLTPTSMGVVNKWKLKLWKFLMEEKWTFAKIWTSKNFGYYLHHESVQKCCYILWKCSLWKLNGYGVFDFLVC